jgi:hypothetical protein
LSRLTCCRVAATFAFAIILPAVAWAQQSDASDVDSPVIPPVPLIQKKNPSAISIPAPEARKFEQKAVAATNLRVSTEAASDSKAASTATNANPSLNVGGAVSTQRWAALLGTGEIRSLDGRNFTAAATSKLTGANRLGQACPALSSSRAGPTDTAT